MNIEEIMKNLDNSIVLTYPIGEVNQQMIDELMDYCIKNDLREKAWRLALTFDKKNLDFSKLADYYIEVKDDWYLSELIYVLNENLKLYDLYQKTMATNDKEFIGKMAARMMEYFGVDDEEELLKAVESYKE